MTLEGQSNYEKVLQSCLLTGVLIGFVLIGIGKILIPTTNVISVIGACFVLCIYAGIFYFVLPKTDLLILKWAGIFGLAASVVFACEILLEYLILPKDNSSWGLLEFGFVFTLYFFASIIVTLRSRKIRPGIISAVMSAMISSLIWFIVVLIVFYSFKGTVRQELVFKAEGNYEDFAKSGMTDFNAFIMEDFFGAGFFHLLIGPILSILVGTLGALLMKMILKISRLQRTSL